MNNRRGTILAFIGATAGILFVLWLHFSVFASVGNMMSALKGSPTATALSSVSSDDNATLKNMAHEANATCPKQINETIRLDSITNPADHYLAYYYTISNMTTGTADSTQLMAGEPNVLNNLKADAQMQYLAKLNVVMLYYFRDKQGHIITTMHFTPDMYKAGI